MKCHFCNENVPNDKDMMNHVLDAHPEVSIEMFMKGPGELTADMMKLAEYFELQKYPPAYAFVLCLTLANSMPDELLGQTKREIIQSMEQGMKTGSANLHAFPTRK